MTGMNMPAAQGAGGRFRRRLTSLGDVKAAMAAGRNQNRQMMRGGRQ